MYTKVFAQCMTTASELIPSLIAQVLSRGLKEKLNPVYFSRLLLLAMNFSSWRNMESASHQAKSIVRDSMRSHLQIHINLVNFKRIFT